MLHGTMLTSMSARVQPSIVPYSFRGFGVWLSYVANLSQPPFTGGRPLRILIICESRNLRGVFSTRWPCKMSGAGESSRRRRDRDEDEEEMEFQKDGGKDLQVVNSFETMGLREELLVSLHCLRADSVSSSRLMQHSLCAEGRVCLWFREAFCNSAARYHSNREGQGFDCTKSKRYWQDSRLLHWHSSVIGPFYH